MHALMAERGDRFAREPWLETALVMRKLCVIVSLGTPTGLGSNAIQTIQEEEAT
jgi:hypothetical protein